MSRTFTNSPAVRSAVPLLVGLSGPSGSGKTYSALRLATGMQRVTGGQIFYIDTEARRALHYADAFKFEHVPFVAPFSPMDYLEAIEHCVSQGAKVIVVDSMSHEHEGPGGLLEMHAAAVEKMSGGDYKKADRVKLLAWVKPKQQRRRLLNSILQTGVNMIFCFRAKEKLKVKKGEEPSPLGWMPIAGEEFVYEMTLSAILPPGAHGKPEWRLEHPGERAMSKLPVQFEWMREREELDEEAGHRMAQWAAGNTEDDTDLLAAIRSAESKDALERLVPRLKSATNKDVLRSAYGARMEALS